MLLILLSVALVVLPGVLVARAAGLSGWISVGVAPLVSYGIAATTGPLTSAIGIPWRPLTMLAATGVLAGACWAVRRLLAKRVAAAGPQAGTAPPAGRQTDLVLGLGVLAGAVLGAVAIMRGIGGLEAIHQGWDAGFHANAIRFISETGDAAPSALSALNNYEDETFFYPNAQHLLTSIVGQLGGASVPALLNVQLLLLPGLAGLGLAVLVRAYGGRVALAASVPLVLASFSGFPYDLLSRGPLLPYATGAALVPAFMALLDQALSTRRPPVLLVAGVAAAGLLAVHPSAALTAAIFTVPMLGLRWYRSRARAIRADVTTLAGVAAVAGLAGLPFVVGALAMGEAAVVDWRATQTAEEAWESLLLLDHGDGTPQVWLVVLLVAGVAGLRGLRPLWWWLVGAALFAGMFVAASSSDAPLVESLTQPWWNDRWRLLAPVILAFAVVAAQGAVVVADALAWLARRLLPDHLVTPRRSVGVAVVAVLAAFGITTNSFYVPDNEAQVSRNYGGGPTVTAAEETAMQVLAGMTGADGRVMNDPGDGSTWMYALEGVHPVFGHVIDPDTFESIGPDQQLLLSSFRCLDSDPAVQALVREYDIRYVFTGEGYLRANFTRVPGLVDLADVDSLELVYAEDGTAIYRVALVERSGLVSGSSCVAAG